MKDIVLEILLEEVWNDITDKFIKPSTLCTYTE
jgi:hypothetical protein